MQQKLPDDKLVICGDPVILQVASNAAGIDGYRMPRVICEVTCGGRTESLSCTVSRSNKIARFNLSDTLTGFMNAQEQFATGVDGVPVKLSEYVIEYSYELFNAYYTDSGEQKVRIGGEENLYARAGSSSDYRMTNHGAALSYLSLKQNSFGREHVLEGFPYLISEDATQEEDGVMKYGVARYKTIDGQPSDKKRLVCAVNYNPMMHHPIIFRNSFGELETCLAWCRQKIEMKHSQDVYITSRAAYDGQRTQLVDSYDDEMQIALTSNYVTPMWAQWWTYEPLRSRRAWIWMPTDLTTRSGCWVPCILKQDNNTILDRSAGASEINFTAVLDWQGGLM